MTIESPMTSTLASHSRRPIAVRNATKHEDKKLADVLARSFWDDPVMGWLVASPRTRYARQKLFFRTEIASVRKRGLVLTTDDLAGAALWLAPKKWKTPTSDIVLHAPSMIRSFGARIPAALPLLTKMEKIHPSEPHWYLAVIGTDPVRQGLGVGGALITQVTDRCDDEGLGAYLESSKATNVPYYERFGFKITEEVTVDNGPTLWGMWRDPR
jgi:ribosomal protein S18 acetylase RimI-like enzyme